MKLFKPVKDSLGIALGESVVPSKGRIAHKPFKPTPPIAEHLRELQIPMKGANAPLAGR
jgi:hypothetical protein